jgi:hypothetical protein
MDTWLRAQGTERRAQGEVQSLERNECEVEVEVEAEAENS